MRKLIIAIFIISGLVPMLSLLNRQPDSLLIYSFFVLACLFRGRLAALADRLPGPTALHLVYSVSCCPGISPPSRLRLLGYPPPRRPGVEAVREGERDGDGRRVHDDPAELRLPDPRPFFELSPGHEHAVEDAG